MVINLLSPLWRRHPGGLLAISVVASLALSACVTQRRGPFNDADFQWASGKGSGTVTGQLAVGLTHYGWTGSHPETLVGTNQNLDLLPAGAYTAEMIQKKYINGGNLAPSDPRYARYVRGAQTDDQGYFTFRHVPPGNYYVGTAVQWHTHYDHLDNDNNLQKWTVLHTCLVYARVSVSNGRTSMVTEWNEGKEKKVEGPAN